MKFFPDSSYHVYNEGNNRELLFAEEDHYRKSSEFFQSYVLPHCEVLCWCLIPNYFHFLLHTDNRVRELKKQGGLLLDPLTNGFRKLLSGYSHEFNLQYERTGALFRPKTKAKSITEGENNIKNLSAQDYFTKCFYYIHNNPVAAGLVKDPGDWKWSSYRFYNGQRKSSFCNKELAYRLLGIDHIV